jgi:hypothetical protein
MRLRARSAAASALTLGLVLVLPSATSALASNTLTVKVPRHTRVGESFAVRFSGNNANASGLAVFLTTGARCKRSYSAASRSLFGSTKQVYEVRRGPFIQTAQVTPTSAGVHYVCGYLYDAGGHTLARAGHKYHTKA